MVGRIYMYINITYLYILQQQKAVLQSQVDILCFTPEVFFQIVTFLPIKDVLSLMAVCKSWKVTYTINYIIQQFYDIQMPVSSP